MENSLDLSEGERPRLPRFLPLAFFVLTAALSAPLSCFVAPTEYFQWKLRTVDHSNGTANDSSKSHHGAEKALNTLQASYESWVTVASSTGVMSFTFLNTFMATHLSAHSRILGSTLFATVLLLPSVVMAIIDTDDFQIGFFAITMATILTTNGFAKLALSSVMGLASKISEDCVMGFLLGSTFGYFLVAVLNILTLLARADPTATANPERAIQLSASLYLSLTLGIMVLALTIVIALFRSPAVYWYASDLESYEQIDGRNKQELAWNTIGSCIKQSWIMQMAMLLAYGSFGFSFPAVMTAIKPMTITPGDVWTEVLFVPAGIILVTFTFILVGRVVAIFYKFPKYENKQLLLLPTLLMLAFVPMFAFCNTQPRQPHLPVYFAHDAYPIVFSAAMASLFGYFSALMALYARQSVDPSLKEHVSIMIVTTLAVGQISGGLFSIPIVRAIIVTKN